MTKRKTKKEPIPKYYMIYYTYDERKSGGIKIEECNIVVKQLMKLPETNI